MLATILSEIVNPQCLFYGEVVEQRGVGVASERQRVSIPEVDGTMNGRMMACAQRRL